jgi:hypothetical protein
MMRPLKLVIMMATIAAAWSVAGLEAQQPTPPMIVVQPAGAVTATPPPAATAASASAEATIAAAIKTLEQVKSANDATLKKQEEMLQRLDELQKAAEQLKVFSKRV